MRWLHHIFCLAIGIACHDQHFVYMQYRVHDIWDESKKALKHHMQILSRAGHSREILPRCQLKAFLRWKCENVFSHCSCRSYFNCLSVNMHCAFINISHLLQRTKVKSDIIRKQKRAAVDHHRIAQASSLLIHLKISFMKCYYKWKKIKATTKFHRNRNKLKQKTDKISNFTWNARVSTIGTCANSQNKYKVSHRRRNSNVVWNIMR